MTLVPPGLVGSAGSAGSAGRVQRGQQGQKGSNRTSGVSRVSGLARYMSILPLEGRGWLVGSWEYFYNVIISIITIDS